MYFRHFLTNVHWGAWFILLVVVSGCSGAAKKPLLEPKVQVRDFEITNITFSGIEGLVSLDVENPNERELSARELNYSLLIAGNELASGQNQSNISIPALGTDTIELPVVMSFASLLETIPDIAKSGLADYAIVGSIKTTFTTIPFSKKGEFKLPFAPSKLKEYKHGHKI